MVTVSCYPLSIYRQMVAFGIYPEIVSKLKGFNATLGHLSDLDNLPCIVTKEKPRAPEVCLVHCPLLGNFKKKKSGHCRHLIWNTFFSQKRYTPFYFNSFSKNAAFLFLIIELQLELKGRKTTIFFFSLQKHLNFQSKIFGGFNPLFYYQLLCCGA